MDSTTTNYFRAIGALTLLVTAVFSLLVGGISPPSIITYDGTNGFLVIVTLLLRLTIGLLAMAFLVWTMITEDAGGFIGVVGVILVAIFFLFWTVEPTRMTYSGLAIFGLAWLVGLSSNAKPVTD